MTPFPGRELTAQENEAISLIVVKLEAEGQRLETGHCYRNARRLVLRSDGLLIYCEGAMLNLRDGNCPHAWATLGGAVIDLTPSRLEGSFMALGRPPEHRKYYGCQIPTIEVRAKDEEVGPVESGTFSDRLGGGTFPILNDDERIKCMRWTLKWVLPGAGDREEAYSPI